MQWIMEVANLLVFLIFGNAQNHRYLCCFAKMTFTNVTLVITIEIFWRRAAGAGQGHGGSPPFGAAHVLRFKISFNFYKPTLFVPFFQLW